MYMADEGRPNYVCSHDILISFEKKVGGKRQLAKHLQRLLGFTFQQAMNAIKGIKHDTFKHRQSKKKGKRDE